MIRAAILKVRLLLVALSLCTSTYAMADSPKPVNVPPGDLTVALELLEKQSGVQIIYRPELLQGLRTDGVTGVLSSEQAVTRLLKGTKLEVRISDGGILLITKAVAPRGKPTAPVHSKPIADAANAAASQPGTLEEVVVTAEKKREVLQDVPVPVTAIPAEALAASNRLRVEDYYSQLPGFNVTPIPGAGDTSELTVRGISPTGSNPAVGITLDDVPLGSSTGLGGGGTIPDIDPSDLSQVELLRGPQGTLYGANSLGGLLKFVTVDPSPAALTGRLQADTNAVENGAAAGYGIRGAVNVPITDTLAIRISGFSRQDPGYIDNPILHIKGVNKTEVYGGHGAAIWKPSSDFSIKISALVQDTYGNGSGEADVPTPGYPQTTGLADLQQNYIRNVGWFDKKLQVYSLTFRTNIGGVDLTAISGYNISSFETTSDLTYAYSSYTQPIFNVSGTYAYNYIKTGKFTQEIRLTGQAGPRVDWLFGLFYTNEDSKGSIENYLAENTSTGQTVGEAWSIPYPNTYAEESAFADLTVHLTQRLDIQIGGRESHIREALSEQFLGPYNELFFGVPGIITYPQADAAANAFTYLVTPRFMLSPDLMIYARLASGYRPGGPNLDIGSSGLPAQYKPDTTRDYELGAKGNFLDRLISVDTSVYYIDWKDIQLDLVDPSTQLSYFANASAAKSQGLELTVQLRPLAGLTLEAWGAWNEAVLTQGFPPNSTAYGISGDRLPNASRFSGRFSAEERFAVTRGITAHIEGAVSYVGDFLADFQPIVTPGVIPARQYFPSYAKTDLNAGLSYELWSANIYVNNVMDKRAAIGGGIGTYPPFAFDYIQPRTIGINFSRDF